MEMQTTNDSSTECVELKNLKYKTMLQNGVPFYESKSSNDLSNLDKFLENEKNNNVSEPWCKLHKSTKVNKLIEFAEKYKIENGLTDEESSTMILFFKDCIDRKKLSRVKDVIYDKEARVIIDIPSLHFNKPSKHFTLKNVEKEKRTSTTKATKKTQGTIRKKEKDTDSEEEVV